MNRLILATLISLLGLGASAQSKDVTFDVYGRIRTDIFYNSRANVESADGLSYIYPKGCDYDADGNDLNATPQGSFYTLYTRLGLDVTGPKLGGANTFGKIEIDFRGSGSTLATPRIRHAYFELSWPQWKLLAGQTWHPMTANVSASILNLSGGAPYQPYSRSPQVLGIWDSHRGFTLQAAAIWQTQDQSIGPAGKSRDYLKNSCIPEFYIGADYSAHGWRFGLGGELISLKPRTQSTVGDKVYKVNERVTSISAMAHMQYQSDMWLASAKTTLASNLTHLSTLGGIAVTEINPANGECSYTPFRHSMTWLNLIYGKKWQPGIFVGYLKNLGTDKRIIGETYGEGLDVDQLLGINAQFSLNLPHWKFGVEVSTSTAWYGTLDMANGRVVNTHPVTNVRVLGSAMFIF